MGLGSCSAMRIRPEGGHERLQGQVRADAAGGHGAQEAAGRTVRLGQPCRTGELDPPLRIKTAPG